MAVDYKKKYREFYLPGTEPRIVEVPEMKAVAVRGEGDPNEENGAYQRSIGLLYAISYAVKMGPKNGMEIPGYFDYVVPPLEGFWRAPEETAGEGIRKEEFQWISLIRLPEFVDERIFAQAAEQVERKKKNGGLPGGISHHPGRAVRAVPAYGELRQGGGDGRKNGPVPGETGLCK